MKIIDDVWLCELDSCVSAEKDCFICGHCIDGIYYAEKEAEEMLKAEPFYIDGDGIIRKI